MTLTNGASQGPTTSHHDHSNGTSKTTSAPSSTTPPLPIIIAGGGCVGLFLALLLTTSPTRVPNPIIVLEPQSPDPTSTRAMAHQPPTYPILSRVPGLLPDLISAGSLSSGLCFRTSVANGSKVIASKTFDNSGEGVKGKGQLLLPQGRFQAILLEKLAVTEKVTILIGAAFSSFTQHATHVSVTYTTSTTPHTLDAAFLIGADGAHSLVRKMLGATFDGATLDAHLVATDIHFDFAAHGFHDANFIVDTQHHGLIARITNHHAPNIQPLWRVSYAVHTTASDNDIHATLHDKLAHMLPKSAADIQGYKVVRVAPYKAQQRLASTLYRARVCLVGDAAHLTNPYAGLGLASGIADASSLADVLARVLTGQARDSETLLGAWSQARRRVFLDVVDGPSRVAYERVRSDVSSDEKVEGFVGRDEVVGGLRRGVPVVRGSLETRGEVLEGW